MSPSYTIAEHILATLPNSVAERRLLLEAMLSILKPETEVYKHVLGLVTALKQQERLQLSLSMEMQVLRHTLE